MGAVALTSIGGSALSVEADDCGTAFDLPAALRPSGVAAASRLAVAGTLYDVQGAAVTVNAAIDLARSWRRVTLAADVALSAIALGDITGLGFAVAAGKRYVFRGQILFTVGAATTGAGAAINGPAASRFYVRVGTPSTLSTMNDRASGSYDSPSAAQSASVVAQGTISIDDGWVEPTAAGTIQARGCSELAGTPVTFKAGSWLEYREVPT